MATACQSSQAASPPALRYHWDGDRALFWRHLSRFRFDDNAMPPTAYHLITASHHLRRLFSPTCRYIRTMASPGDLIVEREEVHRFMTDVMKSQGVNPSHADQLADVLVEADLRGHYSHGLNRLDMYLKDIHSKVCKVDGTPTILKERAGSAWVDGHSLLGPVVGNFCMDLAIKKAKDTGVGWVVAKGSNHYGICGWYVLKAMEQGMMAMSFTNTSPVMYPTRSSVPALGTNPLSLGANGTGGDSYVLDMATTTVAIGKVEISERRGHEVPETWGVMKDGTTSTDPSKILHGGGLYPLGGDEICGGYKGYGMGSLVEIFCGILAGAHWGPNIRKWMSAKEDADLGQCFIAVDPEAFAPGFSDRMQDFMDTMRNLPPVDPEKKVLVPGDKERVHQKVVEQCGGIPYHPNQITNAELLAKTYNVAPMKVIKVYQ